MSSQITTSNTTPLERYREKILPMPSESRTQTPSLSISERCIKTFLFGEAPIRELPIQWIGQDAFPKHSLLERVRQNLPPISPKLVMGPPLATMRQRLLKLAPERSTAPESLREPLPPKSETSDEACPLPNLMLQKRLPTQQVVQGVARGVVSPAVSIPFSTREIQLQNTPYGEPKPPLSDSFNNYGRQWKLQAPNKILSSLAFMTALPVVRGVMPALTDSEFAQKVVPYAACSFVEAGVSSPISVVNQQLRLKKNVTIIGIVENVYKTDGVKGFYRGGVPHATASAVYNMIIFPVSDEIVALASKECTGELSEVEKMGLGFMAGSGATLSTLPVLNPVYRVIGEQKQQRIGSDRPPQSFCQTGRQIMAAGAARAEGPVVGIAAELYKGSSISLIRAPVTGGVIIMINQCVKSHFESESKPEKA